MAIFELIDGYRKSLSMQTQSMSDENRAEDLVDGAAILTVVNERFLLSYLQKTERINVYQIACMFWICSRMGLWDSEVLKHMENHLITNINVEIDLQKQYRRDRDDRTDAALQTIRISDLDTISHCYD